MADKNKPSSDVFSIERLKELIDLMKEHQLTELDLRQSEQQIRLVRGGGPPPQAAASIATPSAPVSTPAAGSAAAPPADGPNIVTITSPMVGTFYSRPNPNAKDYVQVGSSVAHDTTVCIIEAMKVFNEIPAEIRGKVVEILVQNEEAVDFGRPLFKINTSPNS